VRRFGTQVLVLEPTAEALAAMGRNWMGTARRQQVIEIAERTVLEQLRRHDLVEALRDLPAGEPHKVKRPEGPPSSWPPLRPAARRAA
jgi:hypothetical protein